MSAPPLNNPRYLADAIVAVALFYLAQGDGCGELMAGFPIALVSLAFLSTPRRAFYAGLAVGLALYAPPLAFFWTLFGPFAVLLWTILAFWVGLFLALAQALRSRLSPVFLVVLLPVVWLGLEYFRSELYPLRFSWLTPGDVFAIDSSPGTYRLLGVYGVGAILIASAAMLRFLPSPARWLGVLPALALLEGDHLLPAPSPETTRLVVAGAQTEGWPESQLPAALDHALAAHPDAELFLLPEYSLDGEPDAALRGWCRAHGRHLIVGGRQALGNGADYFNTAWVIDPKGELVFSQAKSVPIQFFRDGRPAESQQPWPSPWGPLGIAICYDLSYTRVMDRLVRQGAVALIIPTMDAHVWGEAQHTLHARVAPIRAAEYGLPIARCASSGISQIVTAQGGTVATAPFSDSLETFGGTLVLRGPGSRPIDRWLGPAASLVTGGILLWLLASPRRHLPGASVSHQHPASPSNPGPQRPK